MTTHRFPACLLAWFLLLLVSLPAHAAVVTVPQEAKIPPAKSKQRYGILYLIREGAYVSVSPTAQGAIISLTSGNPALVKEIQENGRYFLKMQSEFAGADTAIDPVTGTRVIKAKAAGSAVYKGRTYYFCCPGVKETFLQDPEKYLNAR